MKNLIELERDVITWADAKGILAKATPLTQMTKTLEEIVELNTAVVQSQPTGIKDGIGDSIVTLIIQAEMQGLTIAECLQYVLYDNDSPLVKRQGAMIEGVFVKAGEHE
jgi:hypothetical protein